MPVCKNLLKRQRHIDKINYCRVSMANHVSCACCYKKGLGCKLEKRSCRCKECYCSNVPCKINPSSLDQQDKIKVAKERLKVETAKVTQAILENTSCLLRLQRQENILKERVSEMLYCDVDSLEELEEIKRLEAKAAEKAKNSLPAPDPYGFLADVDFPFDPQTLAYLEVPPASQGSGSRTLPVPSGSYQLGSSQVLKYSLNVGNLPILLST